MKIKYLVFVLAAAMIALVGCGLEKSTKTYSLTVQGIPNTIQNVSYSLKVLDNTKANGYVLNASTPSIGSTVEAREFYSTSTNFSLPQITLNRMQVSYSVDHDSNNILAGWSPTTIVSSVNIVLPRAASTESFSSVNFNSILPQAHLDEVASKIIAVAATPSGGTYSYNMSLLTDLIIRADVLLSGSDENGNAASASFSTGISYLLTQ